MSARPSTSTAAGNGQGGSEKSEACFDNCNVPYKFVGENSDAVEPLCKDGSDFRKAYAGCVECVKNKSGDAEAAATELMPSLVSIVSLCSLDMVTSTMTVSNTGGKVSTMVLLLETPSPTTQSADEGPRRGPPWGDGPPPVEKCSSIYSAIGFYPPFCTAKWLSGGVAPPTPTPTGLSTSVRSTNTAEPTTSAPIETADPIPAGPGNENNASKAWIAGPVIGAVVGLALVVGLIFLLRRRRHGPPVTAPELEAEKAPKELQENTIHEMEGSSPIDLFVEKPANEFPAKELNG